MTRMRDERLQVDGVTHHLRHKWTLMYGTGCLMSVNRPDNIRDSRETLNGVVTCLSCIREAQAMEMGDDAI